MELPYYSLASACITFTYGGYLMAFRFRGAMPAVCVLLTAMPTATTNLTLQSNTVMMFLCH